MARTKQTARRAYGGKTPRIRLPSKPRYPMYVQSESPKQSLRSIAVRLRNNNAAIRIQSLYRGVKARSLDRPTKKRRINETSTKRDIDVPVGVE